MSKEIKTYKEMNTKICGLLRLNGDQVSLYAAQRIKELEDENDKIDEYKCVIEDISAQCEDLRDENQSLRDRLGKSVELPCKVGDKAWLVVNCKDAYIVETFVERIKLTERVIFVELGNSARYLVFNYSGVLVNNHDAYLKYKEAEARLAELGGNNEINLTITFSAGMRADRKRRADLNRDEARAERSVVQGVRLYDA